MTTIIERSGAVTFKGNPLTLVGDQPDVGHKAPSFTAVGNDLSPVELSAFDGKVVVILSVPSLDTPVCDTEIRRFNEEASGLGDDVAVLTLSMDLPFAQARWCGAAGVESVTTLSDYKDHSFAEAYGLCIKELGLLARAVLVLDRQGTVQYKQLVTEVAEEPDYAAAINAAKAAL